MLVFNACHICPHQARTNANDKITVKDYIFLQKTSCIEKILKYKTCRVVDPSKKKVPDLSCEVQDLLPEVVDLKQEVLYLRSAGIPQFNPWKT